VYDGSGFPEKVGIRTSNRRFGGHTFVKGDGYLQVTDGQITLTLNPRTSRIAEFSDLTHTKTTVKVYHQRLLPYPLNVSVLVDNTERQVCVTPAPFGRKRLLGRIRAAGFQIELHRTWTFSGIHYFDQVR
jgi:hypothetical protein